MVIGVAIIRAIRSGEWEYPGAVLFGISWRVTVYRPGDGYAIWTEYAKSYRQAATWCTARGINHRIPSQLPRSAA